MRQNNSSLIFHKESKNLKSHKIVKEVNIRLLLNKKNELIKGKENTVFKTLRMEAGFGSNTKILCLLSHSLIKQLKSILINNKKLKNILISSYVETR